MSRQKLRLPERNQDFRDARNLLYYVIKAVIPGSPDPTPVQYDICKTMQEALEPIVFGVPGTEVQVRRLIVEGFRGVAKSLIASVMTIWCLYWNPNLNGLIISASKERADAFSTFTLRCIRELPQLQWLQPSENGRDSMVAFDVGPAPAAHAPSVKSVGITGMITGSRADFIIADDIEVPNNSETDMKRARLAELVKEFASVGKPLSATLFLGTPQIEMTLYNLLCLDRGYRRVIWPARYPDELWMLAHPGELSSFLAEKLDKDPSLVGKPTDPERFNELVLLEKEAEYAKSGFAMQFMLDTSMSDAAKHPLKLADLIITDFGTERAPIDVVWSNSLENAIKDLPSMGFGGDRFYKPFMQSTDLASFEGSVMHIDPAGRGKDELTYAVTRLCGAMIYYPALSGFFGGYEDFNLIKLCEIAKAFGVRKIVPESNFGNGMFTALLIPHLKKIHPDCAIEEFHSVGQKEKRIIETLEPLMNQHKIVVATQVIKDDLRHMEGISLDEAITYRLCHQLTRITRDRGCLKHDDRVDVMAMGAAYWVNHMKNTRAQASSNAKAKDFDKAVEGWYREAGLKIEHRPRVGHSQVTNRFITKRR